jgi:hypothetical protein
MALSSESVRKAWYILHEINPNARNSFIKQYDEADPLEEDTIIGVDRKADDGWENIFLNVKGLTADQLATFNRRKKEVPNSSFIRDKGDGITRIGWF